MKKIIVTLFAIASILLFSSTALANNAPGSNGTVKIEQIGGNTPEIRNEPHVACGFFIEFFFADSNQAGSWWIQSWPPTGNMTTVLNGTYLTDTNGHFRTADLSLPTGHFKLFWVGRNDKNIKHKTFWVEPCVTSSPSPSVSVSPSASESVTPSESTTPSESASVSPSTTGGTGGATGTPNNSPTGGIAGNSGGVAGATGNPTIPPTDAVATSVTSPSNNFWLTILILGGISFALTSLLLVRSKNR